MPSPYSACSQSNLCRNKHSAHGTLETNSTEGTTETTDQYNPKDRYRMYYVKSVC